MTLDERLKQINQTMQAIQSGWPFFMAEIERQIADKTADLIAQENEQTRGAIKAFQSLRDLPEALHQEREAITAALSPEDAAHD
jgi:hypothetical protein